MKKRICNKTINFEMNTIKGIIRIISGNIQDSVINGPAFLLTPASAPRAHFNIKCA